MLVVDASAVHYALVETTFAARRLRRRMVTEAVAVPELHDPEVISTVRGRLLGGKMTLGDAEALLADHASLPLDRYSHQALRVRIWELRHNLTAYDAAYVALAESLEATLITTDQGIKNAPGTRCDIELIRG